MDLTKICAYDKNLNTSVISVVDFLIHFKNIYPCVTKVSLMGRTDNFMHLKLNLQ